MASSDWSDYLGLYLQWDSARKAREDAKNPTFVNRPLTPEEKRLQQMHFDEAGYKQSERGNYYDILGQIGQGLLGPEGSVPNYQPQFRSNYYNGGPGQQPLNTMKLPSIDFSGFTGDSAFWKQPPGGAGGGIGAGGSGAGGVELPNRDDIRDDVRGSSYGGGRQVEAGGSDPFSWMNELDPAAPLTGDAYNKWTSVLRGVAPKAAGLLATAIAGPLLGSAAQKLTQWLLGKLKTKSDEQIAIELSQGNLADTIKGIINDTITKVDDPSRQPDAKDEFIRWAARQYGVGAAQAEIMWKQWMFDQRKNPDLLDPSQMNRDGQQGNTGQNYDPNWMLRY